MKVTNETLERSSKVIIVALSILIAFIVLDLKGIDELLKGSVIFFCLTIIGLEVFALHIHAQKSSTEDSVP